MSGENKALFQRLIDGMNAQDPNFLDRLLYPNFIENDPQPSVEPGIEGMRQMMGMFFSAFPDLKVTINQLVTEEDLVVGHMTTEGTQTGEFMGMPATGKKISITEMHMVRIANGKAVEHWGLANAMAMMQQLGVIPEQ